MLIGNNSKLKAQGSKLIEFTQQISYFRDVISTLIGRELKIRYKGSWLGLAWSVLSPLGTVAVLHILFTTMLPLNIPHYATFVYSGLLPWTWFQAVVQISSTTLIDNRDLVRKPFFPNTLLPAVTTGTHFLLYLLALPVLFVLMLIEGIPITPGILILPVIWLILAIFALGWGLLVAAIGVLIRDLQHLLGVLLLLWFYMTPIFYDPNALTPEARASLQLNPMTALVQAHRAVTMGGRMPDWGALGLCLLLSLGMLILGLGVFRALHDSFAESV